MCAAALVTAFIYRRRIRYRRLGNIASIHSTADDINVITDGNR